MAVSDQNGSQTPDMTASEQIVSRLREEPGAFSWQQAVRILEEIKTGCRDGFMPPGFSHRSGEESPRLAASPDMNHAYADVAECIPGDNNNADRLLLSLTDASQRRTLLGAHGVLPAWYSELALERMEAGDHTLVDFLAMFEHRLLALGYRAWWHHRVDFRREKNAANLSLPDMDVWFDSMAGLGTPGQRGRLHRGIGWLVRRFAPLFANAARPASGLAVLLSAYAGTGVRIHEMVVRWCKLDDKDRNCLPAEGQMAGINCTLGHDLVLGETVPEAQSNYNIILGPMSWKVFLSFLPAPGGNRLEGLYDLARLFSGPDRSFGVRMQLDRGEVRGVCLGGGDSGQPFLGWNVWLATDGTDRMASEAFFVWDETDA